MIMPHTSLQSRSAYGKVLGLLLFSLLAFAIPAKSQYARFSADTNHLRKLLGSDQNVFKRALMLEWRINGQPLVYGSLPVEIRPDPETMDTILFRTGPENRWDTILCNIRRAGNYEFVYNTCCGGFDLREAGTNRFIQGSVLFTVVNRDAKQQYLGRLGEASLFVPEKGDTLFPNCRSVMSPNVYEVSLTVVEPCADSTGCTFVSCEMNEKNEEVTREFWFRELSTKAYFLYMPLDAEPLEMIYDVKTGVLTVR
jgi:hypothetical protein